VIANHLTLIFTVSVTQKTVQVDKTALLLLTQESLEKSASITKIEEAATQLYKALQAGRDTGKMPIYLHNYVNQLDLTPDMAATMERLNEYRTYNTQFCKRMFDFLSIMFVAQVIRSTL
jgi:exocyst complex component 1